MDNQIIDKVYEILPTLYMNRDESHGIQHVERVFYNAKELLKNLSNKEKIILFETGLEYTDCKNIIEIASLLHDAWDHKYLTNYKEILQKKEFVSYYLNDFIKPYSMNLIFDIIDNISYSQEIKGLKKDMGKYEILRNIVSDADKLEAIGSSAIDRMISFNLENNKNDHYNIINKHCKDKLFRLKDFIHTSYAKDHAKTLERQLKLLVSDEIILNNYINNRVNVLVQ